MRNHNLESVRWLTASNGIFGPAHRLGRYLNMTFLTVLFLLAVSVFLTGCGPMQVRAGKKPDVSVLQKSLQVGKSTQQDVRAVIGEPDGQGRSMFPWQDSPRTLWSYYYEEGVIDMGGSGSDDRRIFLFLFFDGDKYDGYMWFSNLNPPK
jgi:hypothetical protein